MLVTSASILVVAVGNEIAPKLPMANDPNKTVFTPTCLSLGVPLGVTPVGGLTMVQPDPLFTAAYITSDAVAFVFISVSTNWNTRLTSEAGTVLGTTYHVLLTALLGLLMAGVIPVATRT